MKLEVGTKLAKYNYGKFTGTTITVNRVTAKRAYADGSEFDIEQSDIHSFKARGTDSYSRISYMPATDDNIVTAKIMKLSNEIANTQFDKLPLPRLQAIKAIIDEPLNF